MTVDTKAPRAPLTARVAEEIRSVMGRRRMTGAGLARALGVSQMWVSYRLNAVQPIDVNDLERIADALGVQIVDLLPRDRRHATGEEAQPRQPGRDPLAARIMSRTDRAPKAGRPANYSRSVRETRPVSHQRQRPTSLQIGV